MKDASINATFFWDGVDCAAEQIMAFDRSGRHVRLWCRSSPVTSIFAILTLSLVLDVLLVDATPGE